MTIVNVGEAKAQLSRLLDAAIAGDEVVLARNGTPLVRLVPIAEPRQRELGFVELRVPEDRFDPLDGDDLRAWE